MHDLWKNSKKSTKKAIFLDRDGTLNVDYGYIFEPSRIHLIEGAKQAIEIFLKHDFLLFLLTNQSGIERKMYSSEDVEACNRRLMELLGNPYFSEICVAPEAVYSSEGYRKPSPRFINEVVEKYQLDRNECYMIGDKETDAFTGINAGIKGVLLESNYPKSPYCLELIDRGAILVFKNLIAFAQAKFGDNV